MSNCISRQRHLLCRGPGLLDEVTRRLPAVLLCSLGLALVPTGALAQQWVFVPVVEVGVQHTDNPRLQEEGSTSSITGGLVGLAGEVHRNTETSSVVLRPAAQIYRYNGDGNEDSESLFFDMDANKDGQRSKWRFRGNFRQQQVFRGETASAEVDEIGIDDATQTGTGRTSVQRERNIARLRPGATFEFTERTALKVDVNYLDVSYDTETEGEAVDYSNGRGDIAIARALSPNSSLEFGVFASRYEPDSATRRETESTGVRARYERSVSDISRFFVDIGVQESDVQTSSIVQEEVSESSFLWNIGYDRRWERTRWRFDVGQAVTPNGSGFVVERDLYRTSLQHQFKPRWAFQLSAVAINTETVGDSSGLVTVNDRDYIEALAALTYDLTRNWSIEGQYQLTHQDFDDTPGDAQENLVQLSVIYQPPVPTR